MIEFSGIDIVLDRMAGDDQLRNAVAATLSIEAARVAVIHDMADYPEGEAADVVCVLTQASGEFIQVVSIQCEPVTLRDAAILDVVGRLSSVLHARILAPDEGPDADLMWLLEPGRAPVRVELDADALDGGAYQLRGR